MGYRILDPDVPDTEQAASLRALLWALLIPGVGCVASALSRLPLFTPPDPPLSITHCRKSLESP